MLKLLFFLALSPIQAQAYSWNLLCAVGTATGGSHNGKWSQISPTPGGNTWKKVGSCGPGCAGTSFGGYCWYQTGYTAQSCTNVCSTHGGVNDATINFAGSAGSDANCAAVLDALGAPADVGNACSVAPNGNTVVAPSNMPCISACGPDPWAGCNYETIAGTTQDAFGATIPTSGTLRRRCTDGSTTYTAAALQTPPANLVGLTAFQQSFVCACNN